MTSRRPTAKLLRRLGRARLAAVLYPTVLSLSVLFAVNTASACPDIDGLVDRNCDGELSIIAFGDSITYGLRDKELLGYPGRLGKTFLPNAKITNLGVPGENTFKGRARAGSKFKSSTKADYILILEGANDYFMPAPQVPSSKDNLLAMLRAAKLTGAISLLSELTPTSRVFQRAWISGLNRAITPYTAIDYYSLSTNILSYDQLHPTGKGYQTMARVAIKAIRRHSAKNRPADHDTDGLYDFEETQRGTNPRKADSDGDGISDGAEVYRYKSHPLKLDSDGDGFSDDYEVNVLGSDPASARPSAPRLDSLQVLQP